MRASPAVVSTRGWGNEMTGRVDFDGDTCRPQYGDGGRAGGPGR